MARLFGTAQILREEVGYRLEPRERALREPYWHQLAASWYRKTFLSGIEEVPAISCNLLGILSRRLRLADTHPAP